VRWEVELTNDGKIKVLWFIDNQEVGAFYFENKGIDGLKPTVSVHDVGSKFSFPGAPANQHEEEKVSEPVKKKGIVAQAKEA